MRNHAVTYNDMMRLNVIKACFFVFTTISRNLSHITNTHPQIDLHFMKNCYNKIVYSLLQKPLHFSFDTKNIIVDYFPQNLMLQCTFIKYLCECVLKFNHLVLLTDQVANNEQSKRPKNNKTF